MTLTGMQQMATKKEKVRRTTEHKAKQQMWIKEV